MEEIAGKNRINKYIPARRFNLLVISAGRVYIVQQRYDR
jgi:hypothetical protein